MPETDDRSVPETENDISPSHINPHAQPLASLPERPAATQMDRDLSLMMNAVGLWGTLYAELGGNDPRAANDRGGSYATAGSGLSDPPDMPDCYRRDLDPIERACRLQLFIWRDKLTVTEAARQLGRSRAYVRNHLRLLRMPIAVQDHVQAGRLSEGHARAIAKMRDPEAMADLIIRRQLSVRAAETLARRLRYIGPDGELLRETAIPDTALYENLIEHKLNMKVEVKDRAGRGKVVVHYNSPDEALEVFSRLTTDDDG